MWKYNGDPEKPTFSPDLQALTYYDVPGQMNPRYGVYCRFTIRDGRINYHPESKHHLSGKTIDMTEFPG